MATVATICVRDVLKPDDLSNRWLPRRRAQSEATRLLNLRAQHAHTTSLVDDGLCNVAPDQAHPFA
jgi:hypothetical protein